MKPAQAANAALVFVVLGWLLALYGSLSQMGDPSPSVARATLEAHRLAASGILLLGIVLLFAALWLSGYAFGQARRRAVIAAGLCTVPAITLFAMAFLQASWR